MKGDGEVGDSFCIHKLEEELLVGLQCCSSHEDMILTTNDFKLLLFTSRKLYMRNYAAFAI